MNAVSVNVSTYCDLEKISSDKFDPLIINTIPVEVQNLLPYCHDHHHLSDIALRYLLITLTHNKHFISSPSSAHYTLHIAGTIMLVAGAGSYYCLCFQLGVIICYAVSPSAVSSLFINNITHILAPQSLTREQTKTAPHDDERQMKVIKTCYMLFFANRYAIYKEIWNTSLDTY